MFKISWTYGGFEPPSHSHGHTLVVSLSNKDTTNNFR